MKKDALFFLLDFGTIFILRTARHGTEEGMTGRTLERTLERTVRRGGLRDTTTTLKIRVYSLILTSFALALRSSTSNASARRYTRLQW